MDRPQNNPRRQTLKRVRAQELRSQMTDAERKLWARLRGKKIAELRFRRQEPIGPYIADLYCSAAKLIVELDGGQHGKDENIAYDAARTIWLTDAGYRVLRFSNHDFCAIQMTFLKAFGVQSWKAAVPSPNRFAVRPSLKGRVGLD